MIYLFDSDWLKNLFGGTLGAKSAFDSASQGMKSGDDYMSFTGSTIKNPFESKMPPGGPSMSPSIPGMPSATGGKSSQLPEWANTEWGKRVYDITQTDPFGGTNDYYQNGQYVPDGGASMRPSPQPEQSAKPMIDPAQFTQPQVSMNIEPARPAAHKNPYEGLPIDSSLDDAKGTPAATQSSNMGAREQGQNPNPQNPTMGDKVLSAVGQGMSDWSKNLMNNKSLTPQQSVEASKSKEEWTRRVQELIASKQITPQQAAQMMQQLMTNNLQ
jgi:hypothetical protein